ncbi:MAG TPA: hypothetical protein VHE54_00160 [Puia sp.]|nr:hypothetical protein [Puia sp.]
MGAHPMKSHISRPFLREIETEFNSIYPYLRIEFPKSAGVADPVVDGSEAKALRLKARDLLQSEVRVADGMTVKELEAAFVELFAVPVQIFRKSARLWIETKMTRDWTLRQQNDRGRELAPGEEQ